MISKISTLISNQLVKHKIISEKIITERKIFMNKKIKRIMACLMATASLATGMFALT
jgi:hypothetical protein